MPRAKNGPRSSSKTLQRGNSLNNRHYSAPRKQPDPPVSEIRKAGKYGPKPPKARRLPPGYAQARPVPTRKAPRRIARPPSARQPLVDYTATIRARRGQGRAAADSNAKLLSVRVSEELYHRIKRLAAIYRQPLNVLLSDAAHGAIAALEAKCDQPLPRLQPRDQEPAYGCRRPRRRWNVEGRLPRQVQFPLTRDDYHRAARLAAVPRGKNGEDLPIGRWCRSVLLAQLVATLERLTIEPLPALQLKEE